MEIEKFIIKNEFVSSNETAEIINPYTQKVVKKVYKSSSAQINESLDYLNYIFGKYRNLPTYLKAELLEKISEKIKQNKEEFAQLMTTEMGKPIKFSRIETERAIFNFKDGAEEAKRIMGEIIPLDLLKGSENKFGIVKRFPLGVILAITPWNFPLNLVAHKIAPALASGNVVLLKPASATFATGIELVKVIKESCDELGLDFCPVNVVTASGSEIEKFVSDSRVKMVRFTGSPIVGWGMKPKLIMQKVALELGGNAGVIVDKTADLELAANKIALGAFAQAGQSCISVQRVFVHDNINYEFEELLLNVTKKTKFGNPFEEDTIVGPMINIDEAKRAEQWIDDALKDGANILHGGNRKEAMLEPTILVNTKSKHNVNCKEIFAPVLTLRKFSDFKNVIEEVNNSDFGLQAGVFTKNIDNAFFAYNNIETGGVIINDVPTYRMDSMPYGGMKQSGTGREGLRYAIEEMTERKVMVVS
jgi:acyl-CoA reductase-like NAD-dependent aldehyde dehydrogenase